MAEVTHGSNPSRAKKGNRIYRRKELHIRPDMVQKGKSSEPHHIQVAPTSGVSQGKQSRHFTGKHRPKNSVSFKGLRKVLTHDGTTIERDPMRSAKSSDALFRKRTFNGLNMTALARIRSNPSGFPATSGHAGLRHNSTLSITGHPGLKPRRTKSTQSIVSLKDEDDATSSVSVTDDDDDDEYFTDYEDIQEEEQFGEHGMVKRYGSSLSNLLKRDSLPSVSRRHRSIDTALNMTMLITPTETKVGPINNHSGELMIDNPEEHRRRSTTADSENNLIDQSFEAANGGNASAGKDIEEEDDDDDDDDEDEDASAGSNRIRLQRTLEIIPHRIRSTRPYEHHHRVHRASHKHVRIQEDETNGYSLGLHKTDTTTSDSTITNAAATVTPSANGSDKEDETKLQTPPREKEESIEGQTKLMENKVQGEDNSTASIRDEDTIKPVGSPGGSKMEIGSILTGTNNKLKPLDTSQTTEPGSEQNSDIITDQYIPDMILSQSTGVEKTFEAPSSIQNSLANELHAAGEKDLRRIVSHHSEKKSSFGTTTSSRGSSTQNLREMSNLVPGNISGLALSNQRTPSSELLRAEVLKSRSSDTSVKKRFTLAGASPTPSSSKRNNQQNAIVRTTASENLVHTPLTPLGQEKRLRQNPVRSSRFADRNPGSSGMTGRDYSKLSSMVSLSNRGFMASGNERINNFSQFLNSDISEGESRTQRKLWLQRENSIMDLNLQNDSVDSLFMSSSVELKREFERISHEYTSVRRYYNPIAASITRLEANYQKGGVEKFNVANAHSNKKSTTKKKSGHLSNNSTSSGNDIFVEYSSSYSGNNKNEEFISKVQSSKLQSILSSMWKEESAAFNNEVNPLNKSSSREDVNDSSDNSKNGSHISVGPGNGNINNFRGRPTHSNKAAYALTSTNNYTHLNNLPRQVAQRPSMGNTLNSDPRLVNTVLPGGRIASEKRLESRGDIQAGS